MKEERGNGSISAEMRLPGKRLVRLRRRIAPPNAPNTF